jgi:hypothetical protein
LNGFNNYLSAPDSPSLEIGDVISLEAWVKPNNFAHAIAMLKGNGNIAFEYGIGASTLGEVFFIGASSVSTGVISANQESYIMATCDGANVNYYINGNLDSTFSGIIPTPQNFDLIFGYNLYQDNYYSGGLDEHRISRYIRNAAYAKTNYNNAFSPSTFYTLGSQEETPLINRTIIGLSRIQSFTNQTITGVSRILKPQKDITRYVPAPYSDEVVEFNQP